jgi:hypothetical protein
MRDQRRNIRGMIVKRSTATNKICTKGVIGGDR